MRESLPSDQHADAVSAVMESGQTMRRKETEPVQVLEHYHRYLYASRFTKNKRVLICGAGDGYGAAFVSLNAGSVFAVGDNADLTAAAARSYAEYPNLRFETGSITSLAIMEHSMDVAVCFDLIDGCDPGERIRLMDSVKRVLEPSGVLLISAPVRSDDARAKSAEGASPLPSFSGQEFFEFLKQHFRHVRFIAQKPLTLSTMWSLHEWTDDFFRFHAREDLFTLPRTVEMFSEPGTIVALCSDDDIPAEIANNSKSVFYDTDHAERAKNLLAEAESARGDIVRARTLIMRVTGERDAFRDAITVLTSENLTHLNTIEAMQKNLEERAARIASLEAAASESAAAIEELRAADAARGERLEQAQRELDENVGRVLELEQKAAESGAAREELRRMYDEQSVWAEKLSEENSLLMSKVRDLERHLDESALYATSATEENGQLRERIEVLQQKIAVTTDLLAEAERSVSELKPRFEEAARDYEIMRDNSSESVSRAERLMERVAQLELQLEETGSAGRELEEKLRAQTEENRLMAEQIRLLTEAREEREREEAELRTQAAAVEQERRQAAALTQETQKLRARLYELQKQFDDRSAAARNAAQENEKLKARVASMQKSLEEKAAAHSLLQDELNSSRGKIETMHHEFENKLSHAQQWERDNRKKLEHVAELQRKVDEQALAMREMKIDSEKQAIAFDTFQKSQSDLQQRYNRTQIRVQELQQDVSILEQKLERYRSSGLLKTMSKFGLFPDDQQ